MSKRSEIKRAFIVAPGQVDITVVVEELRSRGIDAHNAYEFEVGSSIVSTLERAIRRADLVVAVLPHGPAPNIYFEMGVAHALKKRLLLIASPRIHLPADVMDMHHVHAEADNREAIGFAIDQILASPARRKKVGRVTTKTARPLRDRVERILESLQVRARPPSEHEIEQVILDIVRASGFAAVSRGHDPDQGADLVVWSDDLQGSVGNPLMIEIASRLRGSSDLRRVTERVSRYRVKGGSPWALLIVASPFDTTPELTKTLGGEAPGVLVLTFGELLERLRTATFPDVVRRLRNERVHGGAM